MSVDIIRLAGCAVVACMLVLVVQQYRPDMAAAVSIAAGVVLFAAVLGCISPLITELTRISQSVGTDSSLITPVLKAFGVCLVAQLASDVCRDGGQAALASRIELAGKAAIVLLTLPLLQRVLDLSVNIINGV